MIHVGIKHVTMLNNRNNANKKIASINNTIIAMIPAIMNNNVNNMITIISYGIVINDRKVLLNEPLKHHFVALNLHAFVYILMRHSISSSVQLISLL